MVIIKKYGNRRLYNTESSSYVNLEALSEVIRKGERIKVVDAKTGQDLTRGVLLQVLLEVEGGSELLPVGLLHRMIRHSAAGPAGRVMVRQMGKALEMMDAQIEAFESPFSTWTPEPPTETEARPTEEPAEPDPNDGEGEDDDDEMAALRSRLEALEQRLKK